MLTHFLPLSINGCCDLETEEIFISSKLSIKDAFDTLIHEISHFITKSPEHNKKWRNTYMAYHPSSKIPLNIGNITMIGKLPANIGQISGIQNMLTDYFLLLSYRKFSQRILGTEGQWEYRHSDNKIRLFPTPKGSFPVVYQYIPRVDTFSSPAARESTYRATLAQMKIALGHARRKMSNIPMPDGGSLNLDGDALVSEGREEYKEAVEFAISIGEVLGPYIM